MERKDLQELIHLSRFYGQNRDMIQAGGGNTSLKSEEHMLVKASGLALKDVKGKTDFVAVDPEKARKILLDDEIAALPDRERDMEVNRSLLTAQTERTPHRPSIETFLHAVMQGKFVVHTHPVFVNAMTCSAAGHEICGELFLDDEYVWLPYRCPGYPLGHSLYYALAEHFEKYGKAPDIVFLQNHGLIVSGENQESVINRTRKVIDAVSGYFGEYEEEKMSLKEGTVHEKWLAVIKEVFFDISTDELLELKWSRNGYVNLLAENTDFTNSILNEALCPDQVVYCGESPIVMEENDDRESLKGKISGFIRLYGYMPRYILAPGAGVLVAGSNMPEVRVREEMLETYVKTVMLIFTRGNPVYMTRDECRYISGWENEKYRQKMLGRNTREGSGR